MANDNIVLVVDDERNHADGIVESLEKISVKALAVYNGADALEIIANKQIDVVITDLQLGGDIDGLDVLTETKKNDPYTEVILITAYGTIETCKQAIKKGAFDYLVNPLDIDLLRTMTEQACKKVNIARSILRQKPSYNSDFVFNGVMGKSRVMQGIFEVLKRVARSNISVLIEGESGTGKELIARAVHENSLRSHKPFNPINCAGITETLLESELFGHAKGAFTGAVNDRKGLFETADKGTLFLDEIGDMAFNCQAKLLRVLEDGVVVPVGSNKSVVVDVRIISATNQDLLKNIEEDKFRQDLYFRIKGVSIVIPPLRERKEDIDELLRFFLAEAVRETGFDIKGITDTALEILTNYTWPGNIRQLKNCIRTMVVMCDSDNLDVKDIPPDISQPRKLIGPALSNENIGSMSLNDLEKQAIIDTLAKTGNNREQAAKILGIGERTLYRKIKDYNL